MSLSALAVQNAPLLRLLADPGLKERGPSELGKALGRDKSNVSKTLDSLVEEGLIASRQNPNLTESGAHVVRVLDFADGKISFGDRDERPAASDRPILPLTFDMIAPPEHNARQWSGLFGDDIDALADSIVGRGLKTPPTVRPAGEDGRHSIAYGARRVLAWGRLIERGTWSPDHVELCPLHDGDALEIGIDGLIENVQRVDLDNLEFGEELNRLIAAPFNQTLPQIAKAIGHSKSLRHLESVSQIAREASDADKARYRASCAAVARGEPPSFTWTQLRDSIKPAAPPKPALVLSDQSGLCLIELAFQCNDPARTHEIAGQPGYVKLFTRSGTASARVCQLRDRGLVNLRADDGYLFAKVTTLGSPAGEWLVAQGFNDNALSCMRAARVKVMGELEAAAMGREGRWYTPDLNPLAPQEPAAPEQAAAAEDHASSVEPKPEPKREMATPVTRDEALVLVEILHKALTEPVAPTSGLLACTVGPFYRDPKATAQSLTSKQLLTMTQGPNNALVVVITTAGEFWLGDQMVYGEDRPSFAVSDEQLAELHEAHAVIPIDGRYVTPWLNVEPQPIPERLPAAAEGEQDERAYEVPEEVEPQAIADEAPLLMLTKQEARVIHILCQRVLQDDDAAGDVAEDADVDVTLVNTLECRIAAAVEP